MIEPVPKIIISEEGVPDVYRRTMPFQMVSDSLLHKVAALGRRVSYGEGALIYGPGDNADDIYIIVSGRIEHTLEPGAQARRPVKMLGPGDVCGWAALLANYPHR